MSCVCSQFWLYVNNTGIVLFLSQTDSRLAQWHVCAVFCIPDSQVMPAGIKTNVTSLSVTRSVLNVIREIRCLLPFADVRWVLAYCDLKCVFIYLLPNNIIVWNFLVSTNTFTYMHKLIQTQRPLQIIPIIIRNEIEMHKCQKSLRHGPSYNRYWSKRMQTWF